ncbi:histidine phosphatase family protein [Rhodoferax sp.]|uniref:histidine phosphatase family protein n=1 Tax=Rhodoferax sp. TaxID=50421 RepID=UPI00374CB999
MDATRIIAIRHGETAWNVDSRIQGQLDIPLNDTGRWQAGKLAQALAGEAISTVYSSDLLRALETAQTLAGALDLPVHTDAGLRERSFGVFQGHTFAEIEATLPEQAMRWRKRDPEFAPEGGECLNDFRDRVVACVSALAARHPGELIAVVAHGGVMDVLYRAATHQGLQAPRSWELGNAALNRLLWTPEGFTLVGWADSNHLEQDESLDESTT